MQVDKAKKYKDLELENTHLKKLVADLSLREVMLKSNPPHLPPLSEVVFVKQP